MVNGGVVKIGNGTVDVLSGGSANVAFLSTGSGGLWIADTFGSSTVFTGTVSGFSGVSHTNNKQFIDLIDLTSVGGMTVSYTSAASHTSGTLMIVSIGSTAASIELIGAYSQGEFSLTSGINGTVKITDPTAVNGGNVAPGPAGDTSRRCPSKTPIFSRSWSVKYWRTETSIPFSAKRWAYSDMPSVASQSAISRGAGAFTTRAPPATPSLLSDRAYRSLR